MGFYELAKSRYSTRSFSDRKVSDEDINKSLTKYKVKSAEELTELQYGEILQKIKGA